MFTDSGLSKLDIRDEYRRLGVEVMGQSPDANGWIPARAFGREDRNPSAAVNVQSGRYKDFGGEGENLSLWDVRSRLNGCSDWREARSHYAAQVGVELSREHAKHQRPEDTLDFRPWTEGIDNLLRLWSTVHKPGTSPEAVKLIGGRWAHHHGDVVVAMPIYGKGLTATGPVGWVVTSGNGHDLVVKGKVAKVKVIPGSGRGLIGNVDAIADADWVWKTEGPSDLLSLLTALPTDQRSKHAVVTNSRGCSENPTAEMLSVFTGKAVFIVGDADEPGQAGARKWAAAIAKVAAETKLVQLPFTTEKNHGRDVRDFLLDGHTFQDLLDLAQQASIVSPVEHAVSLSNGQTVPGEDGEETIPLAMREVIAGIVERTGGWPKRQVRTLFYEPKPGEISYFGTPASLFGWLSSHCGVIEWRRGIGYVSKEEAFEELRRTAEAFNAIEFVPHEPPVSGNFYSCETPPVGDGQSLSRLLDFFCLATPLDRELLAALFATPLWGGPVGTRPAFMVTAQAGRGKGKTTAAKLVAQIYGGAVDVSAKEAITDIKTRLLSDDAAGKRIVLLDNVKTPRFSWGELESLITAAEVSGKRLYQGNGARPNLLSWIITLNGASLSTDMAQRTVEIRLASPTYGDDWESRVTSFITDNRQEILGDLIGLLRRPQTRLPKYSRWATWEAAILSRLQNPAECLDLILARRSEVDVEEEEGNQIEELFREKLEELDYEPDRDDVFIPSKIAAMWYQDATGDRNCKTTGASRAIRQARNEGRITRILESRASNSGKRGFRWVGEFSGGLDPIKYDLWKRLENRLQREKREFATAESGGY